MLNRFPALLLCGCALVGTTGCAHFVESRSIELFTHALQEKDFESLKDNSSKEFKQKALRMTESLDDFRILHLPKGKTSVVSVEDVSDTEKKVTVEVGEAKRRLLYQLTKDPKTDRWVVDDIYMRQKRNGVVSAKSITEQMDLLLTVREFLSTWAEGSYTEVLKSTTPELNLVLAKTPPSYLARISQQVIGDASRKTAHRPEAQLNENAAIVKLPRSNGTLIISFELIENEWKIGDLALEAHEETKHITSLKKEVEALGSMIAFLDAYATGDKAVLANVCQQQFFRSAILPGDLTQVVLPNSAQAVADYDVEMNGNCCDVLIPYGNDILKVNLEREESDVVSDKPTDYLVTEVTIYEQDGLQQKRLSAVFTGQAVLQLFAESLAQGDSLAVRQNCTPDFVRRVWSKVDDEILAELPLQELRTHAPRIVTTVFQGALTEITATQGNSAVTYVLKDSNGQILVDDILLPVENRPNSLKENLELVTTIRHFARGWRQRDLELVRRTSSDDFNRFVWHHARSFPELGFDLQQNLAAAITRVEHGPETGSVVLGNAHFGARVSLIEEGGHFIVDDVEVVLGAMPNQHIKMKSRLKMLMAEGMQLQLTAGPASAGGELTPAVPVRSTAPGRPASQMLPPAGVAPPSQLLPPANSEPPVRYR